MRYFASIGTDFICYGIQTSESDVIGNNIIEVTTEVESGTEHDDFRFRKYENGVWSTVKFEPAPNNQPSEIDILKEENESLKIKAAQTSTDFQAFMDYFFVKFPE